VNLLAVDGGNWKTHVALLRDDGALLALARGPESSPHLVGEDGCVAVIEALIAAACADAGLSAADGPVAEVGRVMLAGADLPAEERRLQDVVAARGWARRAEVANDTFAVLRSGTERGWGVAVVCGAGINCVGVAPDGRQTRWPSLGAITGDWGGGYDVGLAAVFAAARSEDGRGPKTSLEQVVPRHFALETPFELAEAIHRGALQQTRAIELAPVVFAEAERDQVAAEIVDRLAAEVVALARVALARLDLTDEPVEVLLGGGLIEAGDGRLVGAVRAALTEIGPALTVQRTASPPIAGAALLALDRLGVTHEAKERARAELTSIAPEAGD